MQPNRLEHSWKQIKPEILRYWDKLTEEGLDACEFKFDLIVEAIRKKYYPGRAHLTLEGEIRDWLDQKLQSYESRPGNAKNGIQVSG